MSNSANDPQTKLSAFLLSPDPASPDARRGGGQESMGMRSMANAIAITQEGKRLKAVQICRQSNAFRLLWAKSSEGSDANWRPFAAECGLSVGLTEQEQIDGDNKTVIGFNSASVAFYHLGLPTAKEDEIAAMIKMQAETLLPLPAEQMELTWRAGRLQNGKVPVTVAAARKDYLQKFVQNVRGLNPAKILLDCEGMIKAWNELFAGNEKDAVVVSLSTRSTQVCLVEGQRLSNSVVLDMGTEDFAELADSTKGKQDTVDEIKMEQTETTERFIRDITSALEVFGDSQPPSLRSPAPASPDARRGGGQESTGVSRPIFVLSNGDRVMKIVVSCLSSAGLDAREALPQIQKISTQTEFGIKQLYEYRVPIGLAMMALERPTDGLSLFERLYRPAGLVEKKSVLYSPKITAAIAAVMLAVFIIVSYAVDLATPGAIEKRLQTADPSADIDLLMQRQKLIKTVASERPNLLELLKQVSESGDSGIKLDSFHFKKAQLVSIAGQTKTPDQIYRFQEALMDKKGIEQVKIQNTSTDSKSKEIKFNMTFHYKNFTQKGTRL
jgi:hypothetical protein